MRVAKTHVVWGNVNIKCKLCREELTNIYRIIVGTYCVSLIANYIYCLFVCFMVFSANFQQYFSYIVVVSYIGGGPGENHRPAACQKQT